MENGRLLAKRSDTLIGRQSMIPEALKARESGQPDRAEKVLLEFSDPSDEPIPKATVKAACGACPDLGNS